MIIGCGEGILETAERRFCNQSSGMTNMAKENPCQEFSSPPARYLYLLNYTVIMLALCNQSLFRISGNIRYRIDNQGCAMLCGAKRWRDMMFTTLPRKRFSDEIVEQMIGLIKDGRLKPGDSLPSEREIAEKLGVSRPPLREALKTLECLGFIEIRQRRKSVVKSVADFSLQNPLAKVIQGDAAMVVQLLEVRKILESWAAAEASRLATEENIRTLETVYQDLERDFQNDELGVDADVRFHLSIYRATQNTVLSHIASTLLALLHQTQRVTRQIMFTETVNKERLLQQHHAILSAIRERNPEKAREAILTHLDYAENYFVTRS
jgi:GntR family transcriptional repressor for pyruvate dehydrogenase complex